jgi:hypothetical protein
MTHNLNVPATEGLVGVAVHEAGRRAIRIQGLLKESSFPVAAAGHHYTLGKFDQFIHWHPKCNSLVISIYDVSGRIFHDRC